MLCRIIPYYVQDYVQDVRYFAEEHRDVRREAFQVGTAYQAFRRPNGPVRSLNQSLTFNGKEHSLPPQAIAKWLYDLHGRTPP